MQLIIIEGQCVESQVTRAGPEYGAVQAGSSPGP